MKKVYDAVAVIGEYTNKNNETKKQYLNVGAVFENDKGALSMKLNAVPTSFNGWISFYVPKDEKQKVESYEGGLRKDLKPSEEFKDDIPF